jgi:hypothetical protein
MPSFLQRLFGGGLADGSMIQVEERISVVPQSKAPTGAEAFTNSGKWTAASALHYVDSLAARKGIDRAPSLAHKAFEVAQWASQSSAAAAIQQMSTRFASAPRASRLYTLAHAGVTIVERSPSLFGAAQPVGASIGYTLTAEEVQNLLGANEALVFSGWGPRRATFLRLRARVSSGGRFRSARRM